MTTPIPQPPGLPLVGNLRDLDPQKPTESLGRLAKEYGEPSSIAIQPRSAKRHF